MAVWTNTAVESRIEDTSTAIDTMPGLVTLTLALIRARRPKTIDAFAR